MKLGDPVLVVATWSSFRGKRGRVVQTHPYLMVVFPGDPRPMRIEEPSVVPIDETAHHGGAE